MPEQARGERRIAPDDLGDLGVEAGLRTHEGAERTVDALERGELGARLDPADDFLVGMGKSSRWAKREQ